MSSGSFSNSNHSTGVSSLLSRIKVAASGQHKQKRKVAQNLLAERKCHKQRLREFPNQNLVVSGGKQDLSLQDYIECSLMLQYNNSYNNYYRLVSFIVSV